MTDLRLILAFGVVAFLVTSCPLPTSVTACTDDDDCPAGYTCSKANSYCVAPGDAGDTTADAAIADRGATDSRAPDRVASDVSADHLSASDRGPGPDSESTAPPCGTVQSYHDDFDDGTVQPHWWDYHGTLTTVSETNQHLAISFAVGRTTNDYSGYYSIFSTDLRASALRIELVDPIDGNASAEALFQFIASDDDRIGFTASPDELLVLYRDHGADANHSIGAFDRTAHRWWQLREASGTVFFETSPDGVRWTQQHQIATPWFIAGGHIDLNAGAWRDTLVDDIVVFDNLNGGLSQPPWCPAASLQDDFADAAPRAGWYASNENGCQVYLSGTALHIVTPNVSLADCMLETRSAYSLDESSVLVHVLSAANARGTMTGLYLHGYDRGLWWQFGLEQDQLFAYGEVDYVATYQPDPVPAGAYRWLRIRGSGGMLYFDARTEADSAPWQNIFSTQRPVSFGELLVGLQVETWIVDPSATGSHHGSFDHYNLPP